MGICLSARIKIESPFHTDGNNLSSSSCKGSLGSVPPMCRSKLEILQSPSSYGISADGNDLSRLSSTDSSGSVPPTPRYEGEILQSPNLKIFNYADLRRATRNFHPDSMLEKGGFGCVYKGWIDESTYTASKPGTGKIIAVKMLNRDGNQGHREWLAEVNYLGQLSHPHLVKLIGYCLEDEHRLLVYEFMPLRSLDNHLCRRSLSWSLRLKVALEAAKGLAFLHSAETKVIHRDFKSSNILLDSNYNAKLADFGLAKDGPTDDKSHVSTRVLGTPVYAAPEYLATGHLTTRSDVYSFGVVLLEMLSGKKAFDRSVQFGDHHLVEWAKPCLANKSKILCILDDRLKGQYSLGQAQKVAILSLRCLSMDPRLRPTMDEIVKELELLKESPDAKNVCSKSNMGTVKCFSC